MQNVPLSPQVFAILSALVEEKTGLHYGLEQRELFGERVAVRAHDLGMDSLLDYYYLLRYDDPAGTELQGLVEQLVVNETFFFRELDQLEALVGKLLVPRVKAGESPRVWSAACSTGEEPLSLAMLLAREGCLEKVEIVATDVSRKALEKARSGIFGRRSLRTTVDPAVTARWLHVESDRIVVDPALLKRIDFRRANLVDTATIAGLGTFDVILCRNVLIYFRDETARGVVDRLAARLKPRGALFVGVSESLLRFGTSLSCEELGGVFVYKKAP